MLQYSTVQYITIRTTHVTESESLKRNCGTLTNTCKQTKTGVYTRASGDKSLIVTTNTPLTRTPVRYFVALCSLNADCGLQIMYHPDMEQVKRNKTKTSVRQDGVTLVNQTPEPKPDKSRHKTRSTVNGRFNIIKHFCQ